MRIPAEVIQSVFHIKTSSAFGSCFVMMVDSHQYIATARHLLTDRESALSPGATIGIDIFHNLNWVTLQCKIVGIGTGDNDIAVLAPPQVLADYSVLGYSSRKLYYGQDVCFLGYPHLMRGDVGQMNNDFPLPFAKAAMVSMIAVQGNLLVLDGHNNPGFSGGPVAYPQLDVPNGPWQIAGVISGNSVIREPVFVENSEKEAPFTVSQNIGLIDCCPIEVGLELIATNPIGYIDPLQTLSKIQY